MPSSVEARANRGSSEQGAPQRRARYRCALVRDSEAAYRNAPPPIKALLDILVLQPGFFSLRKNTWTGEVQAVTLEGVPSEPGMAFLQRHPELSDWCMGLKARRWQPFEDWSVYYTPEELRGIGAMVEGPEF